MEQVYYVVNALWVGFVMDQRWGDPERLPHPIVGFGKLIAFAEKRFNLGKHLFAKGLVLTLVLVGGVYMVSWAVVDFFNTIHFGFGAAFTALLIFFCLSARTLRHEVKMVFEALTLSTELGRKQLSRIVGRDTSSLQPQQIRKAALETLAENLSDGVVAPLFWFALLGVPGMLAYKMINTLDSMIGYKTDRYWQFGKSAAILDDIANFIPARITAFFMLLVSNCLSKISFVLKYGKCHASPNSGYPEAALAAVLKCRFGGPNTYFGQLVDKPFIGDNDKIIDNRDLATALRINQMTEVVAVVCVSVGLLWVY